MNILFLARRFLNLTKVSNFSCAIKDTHSTLSNYFAAIALISNINTEKTHCFSADVPELGIIFQKETNKQTKPNISVFL